MGKQAKIKRSSYEDANSENERNEPKQRETRLNGKNKQKTTRMEKMRFYEIGGSSNKFLTY